VVTVDDDVLVETAHCNEEKRQQENGDEARVAGALALV
jgi:hypothetical protein